MKKPFDNSEVMEALEAARPRKPAFIPPNA